jgi:hypothetical protein
MKWISALLAALGALIALSACGGGGDSTGSQASLLPASHYRAAEGAVEPHAARKQAHQKKKRAKHKAQSRHKNAAPMIVDIAAHVEYRHFARVDRVRWMTAFKICAATPEERLAQAFGVQANWYEISHAYSKEYSGSAAIATEEGCITALQDSESEREAYLASKEGR